MGNAVFFIVISVGYLGNKNVFIEQKNSNLSCCFPKDFLFFVMDII